MAHQTLVILADLAFQPALLQAFETVSSGDKPDLKAVSNRSELEKVVSGSAGTTRLIAFCTDVIVPSDVIDQCSAGAYNFHPGPPAYPGIFPSCFAIIDGATRFGATVHRMTAKVDGGEIVKITYFDMPPHVDRMQLDGLAFNAVSSLFQEMASELLNLSDELTPLGVDWAGPVRTRKHFEQLCQLPEDISKEEFDRRYRAVGEGPDHALTLQLHGHRFRLDNLRDQDAVVRGGQST